MSENKQYSLVIPLFLVLVALTAWHPIVDHDFGMNAAGGRLVASTGTAPEIDHLSVAGEGKPWINRLWGYQLIHYLVYQYTGFAGVSIFTALLAVFSFIALIFSVRERNSPLLVPVFILVLFLVQYRLRARPEIFSFFFLAMVRYLLHLFQREDGVKANWIFLVPAIQLLWVNSHGLFILGIALQGFLLISCILERPLSGAIFIQQSNQSDKKLRILALVILLSVLASLINPFGLEGALVPFRQYQMLGKDSFFTNIQELVPTWQLIPALWNDQKLFLIFFLIFTCLAARPFLKPSQGINLYHFLVFLAFFYLALKANRNIALFALIAAPAACTTAGQAFTPRKKPFNFPGSASCILLIGLIIIRLIPALPSFLFVYPLGTGFYPMEKFSFRPLSFMADNNIQGPVFPTDLRDGNLMLLKGIKPVYDGRLEIFGNNFFKLFHQKTILTWKDFHGEMEKYGVKAVLVRHLFDNRYPTIARNIPQRAKDLYQDPNWSLVYFDSSFCLFIRNAPSNQGVIKKHVFDLGRPETVERLMSWANFYHPDEKGKYLDEIERIVYMLIQFRALETAERITSTLPGIYPDEIKAFYLAARVFATRGELGKAVRLCKEAPVKKGREHDELLKFLGALYVDSGKYEHAERIFEGLLRRYPGSLELKQLLSINRKNTKASKPLK